MQQDGPSCSKRSKYDEQTEKHLEQGDLLSESENDAELTDALDVSYGSKQSQNEDYQSDFSQYKAAKFNSTKQVVRILIVSQFVKRRIRFFFISVTVSDMTYNKIVRPNVSRVDVLRQLPVEKKHIDIMTETGNVIRFMFGLCVM